MSIGTLETRKLTPPEIASLWGVTVETVHSYIRSGELRAINAACPGRNQRPRYKIDVADLSDFERRRTVQPAPKKPRQSRRRVKARVDDRY